MTAALRQRELRHFLLLDEAGQRDAIRRLSRNRMSDNGIAAATGLSVEMVRKILSEAQNSAESIA